MILAKVTRSLKRCSVKRPPGNRWFFIAGISRGEEAVPRPRNPMRDEARRMWEESGRTMKLEDIARALGIPSNRLRKWKTEDKWETERSDSEIQAEKERKGAERARKQRERRTDKKAIEAVQQNEELSLQEQTFCLLYSKSFNATRSYQRAYGSLYSTANVEGCRLLVKPSIQNEIKRLKSIRSLDLMADEKDVAMMHMRIAFSDITDFVEFGQEQIPTLDNGELVYKLDMDTGQMTPETHGENYVQLRNSAEVDGQLIREIRSGKAGTSIKLEDRQKSLDFLAKFFEMYPMDAHKKAYDDARMELERKKALPDDSGDQSKEIEAAFKIRMEKEGRNADP